ncbi:MAG: hypothetical protein K2F73_00720 [Ruminococcus sp.]|nr:hypothetical protein [Ruminococcus sp.]
MAKCKDCLHYKVCRTWFILVGHSKKKADEISKMESKGVFCSNFKDKAEPMKHGKWRTAKNCTLPTKHFVCSECNGLTIVSTFRNRCMYRYCPNCGAKIIGNIHDNPELLGGE